MGGDKNTGVYTCAGNAEGQRGMSAVVCSGGGGGGGGRDGFGGADSDSCVVLKNVVGEERCVCVSVWMRVSASMSWKEDV